jgi:hypothetical protein
MTSGLYCFHHGLLECGFSKEAVLEVQYSEHGMQGKDYVSLDVGEKFIFEVINPLLNFAKGIEKFPIEIFEY